MSREINIPTDFAVQQLAIADHDDGLNQLFDKLWLQRKLIATFVLLAGILVIAVLAAESAFNPPAKRHSAIVQFNFPGAEKGVYPAGQPFSYSDLLTSKVLAEVYQTNQLQTKNISFDRFVNALVVNPYARNIKAITENYQGRLASQKLSRAEIEALEQDYLETLDAAQCRFARISFIDFHLPGLDDSLKQKILTDIPWVWSRQSIKENGILDLRLAGTDFYQGNLLERFEYLQAMEYLKDSAGYLMQAVKTLVADKVGGQVRNPASGMTGNDLQIRLQRLIDYEIEPLFDGVISMGITRDVNKALLYMVNSIQHLQDEKQVLVARAENIESVVNEYDSADMLGSGLATAGSNTGSHRFDDTIVARITDLIEDKNDQLFKQKLLNQRLVLLQDMETIDGDIIKLKRAQERLLASQSLYSEDFYSSIIADIELTRGNFETLLTEYDQLLVARNQKVLGNTASLYNMASETVVEETGLMSRLKSTIVYSVLTGLIFLAIAVLIALFRRPPYPSTD